ncbi:hypothetical protein HAX54_043985, partial [Datura stramonium]|nr:hypothetical protein [Datura stramonium]
MYIFTEFEHDSPGCGIPPGTTVVEIGDDDKTPPVYRRIRKSHPGKAQQSSFIAGECGCVFDDDDYLEPYDFAVYSVSRKTWFHTLNYLGRLISCD